MTTTAPRVTRAQTFCKLAVLIAEGLPAPLSISLHDARLAVRTDTGAALAVWAAALGARVGPAHRAPDGDWIHSGYGSDWHGWSVQLAAYTRDNDTGHGVAEDLSAVRAVADGPAVGKPTQEALS